MRKEYILKKYLNSMPGTNKKVVRLSSYEPGKKYTYL